MAKRWLAASMLSGALASASLLGAPPALAAEGPSVCPAENFWVGAGWGADRGRRSHTGIDLGGKRGSRIFAVEDGRIDRTKLQSNGAIQIVMRGASGSMYYYGHMDEVLIKGGQKVQAGEVIGLMGDTGSPGQVHLHFEYWKSGRESDPVDPEPLVTTICGVKKGKGGRNPGVPAATNEAPAEQPAPTPAKPPEPAPPGDPSIEGEVFSNA